MPTTLGNITLYLGGPGAADDLQATIIRFIAGARFRLEVAVQELSSRPIAEALIAARARGLVVRVILEVRYLSVATPRDEPWLAGGANEDNRAVHAALLRAGVEVITDLNPATFHQKIILRDPGQRSAAVLTGSTNFTPTGTGANLNHLVELRSRRVARVFAEELAECWRGSFGRLNPDHGAAPGYFRVSGVRVKVLFSPDHSPELEIIKQMLKARRRIDFAMFTFARSSGIDDAIIAQRRCGVTVRGVLDRLQANQTWAASHLLRQAGAELYRLRGDCPVRKLHHKLAVIDGQVIIAGSFNYTGPANALNDENVLVVGQIDEADPAARCGQRKLAKAALREIGRVVREYGEGM